MCICIGEMNAQVMAQCRVDGDIWRAATVQGILVCRTVQRDDSDLIIVFEVDFFRQLFCH